MTKEEILASLGGIPEPVYDSLVASFHAEARERLTEISKALAANEMEAAARGAHSVKGSSSNLRLSEIQAAAKQLEAAAKAGDSAEAKRCFDVLSSLIP